MKLLLIAFAVIAAVAADVSHLPSNDYLPPVQEAAPTSEYLPPVQSAPVQSAPVFSAPVEAEPAHELAQDGYRYKTHRRVVYRRHRRDVSHLPSNDYLPPVQEGGSEAAVEYAAPEPVHVEAEPAHELAQDGYRYKTNRRVVYRRHRRDVSHLPSNDYLPPVQEGGSEAPVEYAAPEPVHVEAEPAHELAQDGYRYKTNRRVVYRRHRRDVSHLPSNDYLPPVQEAAPTSEYLPPVQSAPVQSAPVFSAPVEAEPAHELAQDGYRYKTHRRVVYRRHRRDVSHLPSNDYLPPVQEGGSEAAVEYAAPEPVHVEAEPAHELAQDGYRYKTNRRVVYRRHRRDVSHLPSNDYLPPVQEGGSEAPVEYAAPEPVHVEAEPAHELAQDGYRYKTNRRVVYRRHRRDVSHLPSNDYLPPVQEAAPTSEYLPPVQSAPVQSAPVFSAPVEAEPAHELAQDGYRYKTHRRVVYRRHRRDVSHLPSNDYLPPVQEGGSEAAVEYAAPEPVHVEAEPAHELAQDGYRYKTNRRVVYRRHRRDVSHLPSSDYLPPVQEGGSEAAVEYAAPEPVHVEAEPAHELAQDGYRYKTNRRVVYRRHRRDVSHLPSNDYLPPVQEAAPTSEYLPPVQSAPVQSAPVFSAPVEAEPAHELAQDGYRYKTHRRRVFRRRH